jgi:hypothetical protein
MQYVTASILPKSPKRHQYLTLSTTKDDVEPLVESVPVP